ncbi:cytochrome P450 6a9-like [Culicoides brevitarsis]|uniref:cytochrome P450 6a9-like n=1 Tax=Culicoides brevitarsis TaxID=469753 RepID=UPI00307B1891
MFLVYFFSCVILLVCACYLWIRKRFQYWSDNGIPCPKITFPLGTIQSGKHRVHSSLSTLKHYQQFKKLSPICGQFLTIQPAILALDIDLIKNILIKDFENFHDRGIYFNESLDPLSAHLFNLEGRRWKNLRSKLTPTFSSGKMKFMFSTMVVVGLQLVKVLEMECEKTPELEIKDLVSRFTTDMIGTCAFGLDCNSLKNPNVEFRTMGKKVFEPPTNNRIKMFLALSYERLAKIIGYRLVREEVTKFFMDVVTSTVDHRQKNNVNRNDFMDILLRLKNQNDQPLTLNELAAQAFVFFVAGFETSSTVLSFTLFELAQNQNIQKKARNDVINALANHNEEMTYEALNDMTYLDFCIDESLRKYPPLPLLVRKCTKDYYIESINYTMKKGMPVMIPIYAIHHDPDFYENPESFIPERFETGSKNQRAFMPFGEGPRFCIGNRFGLQQTKIGLALLLKNFKFSLSEKTKVPLSFSTKKIILSVDGIWLSFEKN